MLRGIGAGMANLGNTGGDPMCRSAGLRRGDRLLTTPRTPPPPAAAVDAEKLRYDRGRDAQGDGGRRASTTRSARTTRPTSNSGGCRQAPGRELRPHNQKTAAEIAREARLNGMTTSQMLEVERIAQAAGENLYGAKREQAINET